MDLEDPPKTIDETIAAAQFPVYGIVSHPLGLTRCSLFTNIEAIPFPAVTSLTLDYTSPRYPSYPSERLPLRTFRVRSERPRNAKLDGWDEVLDLVIQEQAQPVRNPFLWEGTLSLGGMLFQGKIRYYATPLKLSEYYLLSEKAFLEGYSYGPCCDELIELLEGLQVLNGRDEVIKQYYERH
jgi:hypothetical protein